MMTKVPMSINLRVYQRIMVESLRQAIRSAITEAPMSYAAQLPLTHEHLLAPPSIGFISLDDYLGRDDDSIIFMVSHDFNIRSMRITILDERGDVIESGDASPFLEDPNGWEYFPEHMCLPALR